MLDVPTEKRHLILSPTFLPYPPGSSLLLLHLFICPYLCCLLLSATTPESRGSK
ncbi:hypothetical protein BDV12DRAFT_174975 [Aspergillus spectabilis]